MSDVSSAESTSTPARKPRSRIERAVVWTLIAALICTTAWEAWQLHCYDKTLSTLQARLREEDDNPDADFELSEAKGWIQGWPTEATVADGSEKKVDLKWPSLFKDLRLQLLVGSGDVVLAIASGDELDQIGARTVTSQPPENLRPQQLTVPETAPAQLVNGSLGQSDAPLLMVDVYEKNGNFTGVENGILIRELGRQALLIAGRDELSLPTRDQSLGETFPVAEKPVLRPFGAITAIDLDGKAYITIYRYTPSQFGLPTPEALNTFTLPLKAGDYISQLTTALEPLSRNEFPCLLKGSGYAGSARKFAADEPLSEVLEQRPFHFDVVHQFATVRDLHAEIQQHGESVPRLAALARAYAQLGTLTEGFWSPMHKAFKARALLYAERLVGKVPKHPAAFWNRAFVRALVGLPASALTDLKTAKGLKGDADREPDWLPAIDAYCRSDSKQLQEYVKNGPQPVMATYLHMLAADLSRNDPQRYKAAETMLKVAPDCLRAWDVMVRDTALGVHSRAADVLFEQLQALSEQPQPEQKLNPNANLDSADELVIRANRLIELLKSDKFSSDQQELNLTALRQLIREVTFVLAWRMVSFQRHSLAVNADHLIDQVQPLVADHRLARFFTGQLWYDGTQAKANLIVLAGQGNDPLAELTEEPLFEVLDAFDLKEPAAKLREMSLRHSDPVLRDLMMLARAKVPNSVKQRAAQTMRTIAPLSPATAAASIRFDWEAAKDLLPQWQETLENDLDLLQVTAEQQRNLGNLVEAAQLFEKLQGATPSFRTAHLLANIYRDLDDTDRWKSTLEKALKIGSMGLEDSDIHREIARYHMARREWDLAKPHADEAAESYASWALICAAECYEGLGDWEQAEKFQRANALRYESSVMQWFAWCRATNQGDLEAARNVSSGHRAEWIHNSGQLSRELMGRYFLLDGNLSDSLTLFQLAFDAKPGPYSSNKLLPPYDGLITTLLADELGRTEVRDQNLKCFTGPEAKDDLLTVELARLFRQHLETGSKQPLDALAVEWILHRADSIEAVTNLLYFAGKFSQLRGHADAAKSYYRRAAGSVASDALNRPYAARELRRMGGELPLPMEPVFDPQTDRAFELANRANKDLAEGRLPGARWHSDKALQVAPDCVAARLAHGNIASIQERFKEARDDYDHLVKLGMKNTTTLVKRGLVSEKIGDHAAAIADYEAALQIDPADGNACSSLAILYATCLEPRFRNPAKAMEYSLRLEKCSKIDRAHRYAALGMAHAAQGQFDEAAQKMKTAMQSAPVEYRQQLAQWRQLYEQRKPYVRSENWWRQTVN